MADPVSFAITTAVQIGVNFLFPSDGPRMKDLRVSASTYSNIMPEVWGRVRVAGNMIWSSKIREVQKKTMAGKGGFVNEYTYFADVAMSWCRGPITDLRRIWADGKLIYDVTGASEDVDNGKYVFRLYHGDEEQLPDPVMEAALGEGNCPAFRGQCYVMFENMALEDFGNRIPQFAAEIYVGEPSDNTATTYVAYKPDGDLTSPVSYSSDLMADFDRGYFYIRGDTPEGQAGLRRFRIADGIEDRQVMLVDMIGQDNLHFGWGSLLGVWPDGDLLLANFAGNSSTVFKIDAYSLTSKAQFGLPSASLEPSDTSLPAPAYAAFMTGALHEYACIVGAFGSWTLLDDSMGYVTSGELPAPSGNAVPKFVVGRPASIDAEFYVVMGGSSSGDPVDHFSVVRIGSDLASQGIVAKEVTTFPNPTPGTNININRVVWDEASDAFLMFWVDHANEQWVSRWSFDTQTFTYTTMLPFPLPAYGNPPMRLQGNQMAVMSATAQNKFYIMDTLSGELQTRALDLPAITGTSMVERLARSFLPHTTTELPLPANSANNAFIYDSRRQMMIIWGGGDNQIVHVGQFAASGVTLDYIVETLLRRGGLAGADFDLTPLQDIVVQGFGYASSTDIKSVLQDLKQIYLFDLVEIDGILKAVIRGSTTSVETINGTSLGSSSGSATDFFKETRIMEADLPAQIVLAYMNVDDDFQSSIAPSKRASAPIPAMYSRQQVKIEVTISMDATTAQQRVNAMLYTQWAERTKHNTRVPWAYAYLDPTDCVTVNLEDGRSYFERIHSTELGADYVIALETYGQDSGAYLNNVQGDGGGGSVVQTIRTPKPALPFVFNLPLLRDMDDTGGGYSRYYTGVGNGAPGSFFGATMYRSINNLDFGMLYAETSDVEWGTVVGLVPPPAQGVWALDWETRITIAPAVDWFELESITDDELLSLANMCVIGNEVICFRDCVENDDGTWTIWNLLRGQRGTEWASDIHRRGEKFVFMANTTVTLQADTLNAAGQYRSFKAVGSGRSLIDSTSTTITYQPRDLMPYAPTDIRRTINGGTGDIAISWARRTRMGGGLMDGTGTVPLNETSEAYEVYLLSSAFSGDPSVNAAPGAVRRKIDTVTPSVTYTAAQQAEDGVTNLDTLHLVIYQISAAVGRGFPGVRSFEPTDPDA